MSLQTKEDIMQITEEEINMPFKDKLKSLRTKKNITQEQLHVSRSLIAKWENGRGYPDDETINAMATYFGVDKQYFVEDEDRTKARTMQIVGFAFLSAVVLALVASLFTISFLNGNLTTSFNTQYIVIMLLGLLLLVLGFINISGNVRFIHRYQRRGVNTENMPKYAIFMGLCNGIIGAGCFSVGLIQSIRYFGEAWYFLYATIGVGIIILVYAQSRFAN